MTVDTPTADLVGHAANRSRLRNVAHLVTGSVANAALMLVASVIAARALGPQGFGVMVLVLALGRTVERVVRFESWQPLIRYATALESEVEGREAKGELSRLFAFGFWLDVAAALASALVAVGVAALLGPAFGLSGDGARLVAIYAVALALNWSGMPTAVLRLSGRFRWMAYYQFAATVLRIVLAAACWLWGGGVLGFVVVWTVTQALNALFLTGLSLASLREQDIAPPWRVSPRSIRGRFPGFIPFAISTNLSTTLRTLTTEGDILLVGWLVGPSAAGFLHIAKRLAKVAQQVGAHVQAVVYPDVARLWAQARKGDFLSTVRQAQFALAGTALALFAAAVLVGSPALHLTFGPDFAAALPLLLVQMVAVVFTLHAAPARAALFAMNRPNTVLAAMAAGAALFFVVALLLVPERGALGASIAHVALAALVALLLERAVRRGVDAASVPSV